MSKDTLKAIGKVAMSLGCLLLGLGTGQLLQHRPAVGIAFVSAGIACIAARFFSMR